MNIENIKKLLKKKIENSENNIKDKAFSYKDYKDINSLYEELGYCMGLKCFLNDLKRGGKMNKDKKLEISLQHNKLRKVLRENGSEEFGDVIVDEICKLFDYPTTEIFDKE